MYVCVSVYACMYVYGWLYMYVSVTDFVNMYVSCYVPSVIVSTQPPNVYSILTSNIKKSTPKL